PVVAPHHPAAAHDRRSRTRPRRAAGRVSEQGGEAMNTMDTVHPKRALTLLVYVDFSPSCHFAWQRAAELATLVGAELVVVNAFGKPSGDKQSDAQALAAGERALQQWVLGRVVGTELARRIHTVVALETPAKLLAELAHRHHADILVVGAAPDEPRPPWLAELLAQPPCSLLFAAERREAHVATASPGNGAPVLEKSANLPAPPPLPEPA